MAVVSPFVKLFIIAAASIAIIQGIMWSILAFMVIFLYSGVWEPRDDANTYGQFLSLSFARLYFDGNTSWQMYVTSLGLFIWAIVYLIASIVWIGISSYLLIALKSEKRKSLRRRCQEWSYWTILTSVLDLVLASILARDYNYMVGKLNLDPTLIMSPDSFLPLAIGIVMTLAARGFVLWLLNLMFGIVMIILPIKFFERTVQD